MSAGDAWLTPSGRKAVEMPGSTRDELRLSVIVDGWPYPSPPMMVVRSLCQRLPSRYLQGDTPKDKATC